MSVFRRESLAQSRGLGILELRGGHNEGDIAIYVQGAPFVFDAPDCDGSVARFTILRDGVPQPKIDKQIAQEAETGFENGQSLAESIAPLLELMPNGSYELVLQTLPRGAGWQFVDWANEHKIGEAWSSGIYPDDNVLILTQRFSTLNQERIAFYVDSIQQGKTPTAIAWGSAQSLSYFVLDGHHKLAAYWELKREARILFIHSKPTAPISIEEARNLTEPFGQRNYLRSKRRGIPWLKI